MIIEKVTKIYVKFAYCLLISTKEFGMLFLQLLKTEANCKK